MIKEQALSHKAKIVIFISGSGSNMEALIKASLSETYPAQVVAVISDRADAGGLKKAQTYGIATHSVERKLFESKNAHEDALLKLLASYQADIICLAGFMRLISSRLIAPYENKILNIHPSLLPLFPGLHTHQRAIETGMKIAGCTVHIVTEGMDEGPILAQAAVPIQKDDTADTLASRVLKVEHQLYAAAVKNYINKNSLPCDKNQELLSF